MAHPRTGLATFLTLIAFLTILAALAGPGGDSLMAATDPKPGDAAPAFSLPGSDGRTHTLAEHRGKRVVVLAWFPKAFTGG
jgi:peroxiredoxin Q/BCP